MKKIGINCFIHNYFLELFNTKRIPIIIKSPQIIRADIDFGPVISFTGFPTIKSNVQTNITPKIPSTINIIPFFLIFALPFFNKKVLHF